MGIAVLAIAGDGQRLLDPASRPEDRPAAEAFRSLRHGEGWFSGGSGLRYINFRGSSCDWAFDLYAGPGAMLDARVGGNLGNEVISGERLRALDASLQSDGWNEWVQRQYQVDERAFRAIASFVHICAEHGLCLSFAYN